MSVSDLTKVLDKLDPAELPEAAREAAMRLTDQQLLEHRFWAGGAELDRRKAVAAEDKGKTEAIRSMRETVPALAPKAAKIPSTSPYSGMKSVRAYSDSLPFIKDDLVFAEGVVWQHNAPAPTTGVKPAPGPVWSQVPAPEPEPEPEPSDSSTEE